MRVHVSLHDVAPYWKHEGAGAIDLCRESWVNPALVVMPHFHEKTLVLSGESFCQQLQGLQNEGHEIYLHGYFHKSGANANSKVASLRVLAEERFSYPENQTRIYDPVRKQSRWSLVLNYASRTPARLLSTVAYYRSAKYVSPMVPLRVAIYAADMRYEILRRELRHLLATFAGRFVAHRCELFL